MVIKPVVYGPITVPKFMILCVLFWGTVKTVVSVLCKVFVYFIFSDNKVYYSIDIINYLIVIVMFCTVKSKELLWVMFGFVELFILL